MVCYDESSIPCARNTLKAYRACAYGSIFVVSGISNVEKCRDLEIGVRGHSRSLKVVLFDRLCVVSY